MELFRSRSKYFASTLKNLLRDEFIPQKKERNFEIIKIWANLENSSVVEKLPRSMFRTQFKEWEDYLFCFMMEAP